MSMLHFLSLLTLKPATLELTERYSFVGYLFFNGLTSYIAPVTNIVSRLLQIGLALDL